jgi:hypothetical protein
LNIQNGVRIEGTTTFVEVLINNNAFVDINLNNGELLSIDPASQYNQKAIQEGNSLLPNLRSRLQGQFSATNPITNSTTGAINTPTDINTGALFIAPLAFGVIADPSASITYDRTRPVNFQIIATANLRALSGGANQEVALTIAQNGVNIPVKSFVSLDSAGVSPVPCTLAVVGSANFGDVFTFQLENISAPLDVVVLDINIAGIEV